MNKEKIEGQTIQDEYTLGGGTSNIKLLLALKNLDDFYCMITYLELIGMIKEWKFDNIKDSTTFLIKESAFKDDEEKMLMNNDTIKEMFYNLDIHTFELFTKLYSDNGINQNKLYESHVAKKSHIEFNMMKKFKGSYLADMIMVYDGSPISSDLIVPCTLDTVYKNKWYKLNNLKGLLDYINLIYWYRCRMHRVIHKIPNEYYLINISVDISDSWMFFKNL